MRLQLMHKQHHYMRLFKQEEAKGKEACDYELLKRLQFLVKSDCTNNSEKQLCTSIT